MADYLAGSIKNLNTLLGEQLLDGSGSGGGGGSSDFSTANVKAIQKVLGVDFKTIAYIADGEMKAGYDEADEFFMRPFGWVGVDNPLSVVMYNGHADLFLTSCDEMQIVATKNPDNVVITYDDERGMYNLALTGDCTITLTALK